MSKKDFLDHAQNPWIRTGDEDGNPRVKDESETPLTDFDEAMRVPYNLQPKGDFE